MGEGDQVKANRYFTMMVLLTLICGIVLSVTGMLLIRPIVCMLGATKAMMEDCVVYGRTVLIFNTAFMLQNVFQTFFATAEKPKLGLAVTVAAGIANMALDAVFIAGFKWGVAGAALATGLSQCIGGISAAISFLRTLVFQTLSVLILPVFFGLDGIWWAVTAAEVFAFLISLTLLYAKRKRYHYI